MAKTIKKHWDISLIVGLGLLLVVGAMLAVDITPPVPSVEAATTSATTISVSATVASTITLTVSSTSLDFGTLADDTISATSTGFRIATNATSGYTMTIKDQGDGETGGLYKAAGTTYNIASASTTLSAGTEGYGAQGTTSDSDMKIYEAFDKYDTAEGVGQMATTTANFCSSTAATAGDHGILRLKAAIAPLTAGGSYADTITLTAAGSF